MTDNPSRDSCDDDVIRYVFVDHGIGAYADIVSDSDVSKKFGSGTDEDTIAKKRYAVFFLSNDDAALQNDVISSHDLRVYDDANAM